jgi:hypothetical protein
MTRPRWTGAAAVAVYVAAVVATMSFGGHRVRPLYEGFTPPPPYRWVKPPAAFKAGNQPPQKGDANVPLTPSGSRQASAVTGDSQVVVNLPEGAFAAHGEDVSVHVHIEPLDPGRLGPPPPGLQADGNAYRIDANYVPSNQAASPLAKPGNAFLVVPSSPTALLYSPDGKAWARLELQNTGRGDLVGTVFSRAGFYEAAQPPSPSRGGNGGVARVAVLVGAGVLLALAVLLGPAWLKRRRRRI